jgi:hypothetical protein
MGKHAQLMETLKRRLLSGASLRTSPDTVRSSLTWAAIERLLHITDMAWRRVRHRAKW